MYINSKHQVTCFSNTSDETKPFAIDKCKSKTCCFGIGRVDSADKHKQAVRHYCFLINKCLHSKCLYNTIDCTAWSLKMILLAVYYTHLEVTPTT